MQFSENTYQTEFDWSDNSLYFGRSENEKLDAQIITITGDANKKWTFNSWDKFCLPKPFSKIIIHIAPVYEHNGTKPLHEGVSDYMVKHEKIASHKI